MDNDIGRVRIASEDQEFQNAGDTSSVQDDAEIDVVQNHREVRRDGEEPDHSPAPSRHSSTVQSTYSNRSLKQPPVGYLESGYVPYTQIDSDISLNEKADPGIVKAASRVREVLFFGSVVFANFLSLCQLGQVFALRSFLAKSLNVTNPADQTWFAASGPLIAGTFVLITGRLGDRYGHGRMLVLGYIILGVWSIVAGLSVFTGSQIFFDVCRALQGLGTAFIFPNAVATLARALPKGRKRNFYIACSGVLAPCGIIAGMAFAAVFAEKLWWPWTYWSYGIAAFVLAAVAALAIPLSSSVVTAADRPRMDWLGSVTGVTGLVLINVAWNMGASVGWSAPQAYVLLVVGVVAMTIFFLIETWVQSPLLPWRELNWTASYTLACAALGYSGFGIWLWYLVMFLQELRGLSPIETTIQLTPILVSAVLAGFLSHFLMSHAPVSFTMMVALVLFFAGEAVAVFMPVDQTYWAQTFVSVAIIPFGFSLSLPAAQGIIAQEIPKHLQGLGGTLLIVAANYSLAIALGIAGTVESAVLTGTNGSPAEQMLRGIRVAWYTGLGMAGLGALLGVAFFFLTIRKFWKH